MGEQVPQSFRRKVLPGAAVVLRRVERTGAFRVRRERSHVIVAEDRRRSARRKLAPRLADVGAVAGIERTEPRDFPLHVDGALPRLRLLFGQIGGPVADDRLQENRRLHRTAPEQFRPFPVARHRGIDRGGGGVSLWMQGEAIQAVGIPRARRKLDRIGGRNAFATRHRGDDVQHRERIRQDDFAGAGPVRHG